MYKRVKIKKLGRKKAHRESLKNNLLRSLFQHGYVRTTTTRAGVLKSSAERLISKHKDERSSKRRLRDILGKEELVKKYLEYVAKTKKGVRVIKIGFRPGDMTEMSRVELIGFKTDKKSKKKVSGKEDKKDGKKIDIDTRTSKKALESKSKDLGNPRKKVVVEERRAKSRSGL